MKFIHKVEFNTTEKKYLKDLLQFRETCSKEQLFRCEEDEDCCEHCPFYYENTLTCMFGTFLDSLDYITKAVENV